MTRGLVAVTGATGFLGQRLFTALASADWRVRALVRASTTPTWQGPMPQIVAGDLADTAALARLVEGADAVVHLAGAIKARDRETFFEINEGGALRVAEASGDRHLVLVSSLAAREPGLSDYAASKRAGEEAARGAARGPLTIVRPPAIYGPGDRETLVLFKAALGPIMVIPGDRRARLAVAEVGDVTAAIVDLLAAPSPPERLTIGGDRPEGYAWSELAAAAAAAVGGRPRVFGAPPWLLRMAGLASEVNGALRGAAPIFTRGKARESLHRDWSVSAAEMGVSARRAYVPLADGFARTVAWYRAEGWMH